MPTPITEYIVASQDRALAAIRQSQSATVDFVESWAKSVESASAELPAIPVPKAFPSAEEFVQTYFDFYGKLLAAQREFAQRLVTAAAPAVKTAPVEVPA
ncbi:MAG TPA: hypothetical protein VKD47_06770 [Miltoncostaeaceae bacterium]|nr:hypothetical protein [Miltoncostaeaceae bacterium]